MAKISSILALVLVLVAPATTLAAGNLPLSQTSVSVGVGQNATVVATNPTNARIYVVSISDAFVAYANVSGNTITVYGLAQGFSQIGVCSYDNYCNTFNVHVGNTGSQNQVFFSNNNVALSVSETARVGLSGSNGGYYISSHGNSNVATASISNNELVVTALSVGSDAITVCAGVSNVCAVLNVNVNSGALYFINSSPVPAYVGSYYAFQFSATGGSAPYSFSLASGSLPAGLALSSNGLLYGSPVNNNGHYFTVRVTDNIGRAATSQAYYLKPNGSVQGSVIYNNGTLINDGGTIYITYKNTKSGFASMNAFTGFGYKLSNVINASTAGLTNTGYVITSTAVAHPWGSWVKNGNTIYFMHESGLIPISTFDVFLNNGGSTNRTVVMNQNDFNRPILSVMTMNDSRLK